MYGDRQPAHLPRRGAILSEAAAHGGRLTAPLLENHDRHTSEAFFVCSYGCLHESRALAFFRMTFSAHHHNGFACVFLWDFADTCSVSFTSPFFLLHLLHSHVCLRVYVCI